MTRKELKAFVVMGYAAIFLFGFSLGRTSASVADLYAIAALVVGFGLIVAFQARLAKKFQNFIKTLPE